MNHNKGNQFSKRHMRWFYLIAIFLWLFATTALMVITKNPEVITITSTVAPVVLWTGAYLFQDKNL